MRLIDADALEKEYSRQFDAVYKNIRDTVLPSDFYIERRAAYDKEIVRRDMEAFFEFLQSRHTIDAEPVRHGRWIQSKTVPSYHHCSCCKRAHNMPMSCNVYVLPYYCMDCGAKMDLEVQDD